MQYENYWDLFDATCEIKKKETAPNVIGIIALDEEKNLAAVVCGSLKTMTPRKNTSVELDSLRLRARGNESTFEHTCMAFYFLDHNKYLIYDDFELFRINLEQYLEDVPEQITDKYIEIAKQIFDKNMSVEDAIKEIEKK